MRSLTCALALGCAAALAATAEAEEISPFGINAHAPTGEALERHLDHVEQAGIGWLRVDFVWALIEPERGRDEWEAYDQIVAAAGERDLEILGLLAYTPPWATDGPAVSGVPRSAADWAAFCHRAASRYRGRVRHWELWNEPNLSAFWAGSREQHIAGILLPGAQAVHAADPAAWAGGPALAHLRASRGDWATWLLEALRRAGPELDFVTHHVYDSGGHREVLRKLRGSTPFPHEPALWHWAPPSVREVLAKAGWLERPFWLTETGFRGDGWLGSLLQSSHYRGFLAGWLERGTAGAWPARVFFYELADPHGGGPRYGIVSSGDRRKPAYHTVYEFTSRWRRGDVPDPHQLSAADPDEGGSGRRRPPPGGGSE